MANIDLVIKIPEEKYLYAKNLVDGGKEANPVVLAIGKGTPLPKGYGRLGDLDALETKMVNGIRAGNYGEGYESRFFSFKPINNMDDCVECVRSADTILKADRVEVNKEEVKDEEMDR